MLLRKPHLPILLVCGGALFLFAALGRNSDVDSVETSLLTPHKPPVASAAATLTAGYAKEPLGANTHNDVYFKEVFGMCDALDSATAAHKNRTRIQPLFDKCLQGLQDTLEHFKDDVVPCTHARVLFHSYWRGTRLAKTSLFGLASVLHAHGRGCVQFMLWTDTDTMRDALAAQLQLWHPWVTVTTLDWRALLQHIAMRSQSGEPQLLLSHIMQMRFFASDQAKTIQEADNAIRFVVLAVYGGVYTDLDVFLLRPLYPLLTHDFAYRRPFTEHVSAAFVHIRNSTTHSPLHTALENALLDSVDLAQLSARLHPSNLVAVLSQTLVRFPSAFFDPLWALADSTSSVLSGTSHGRDRVNALSLGVRRAPLLFTQRMTPEWRSRLSTAVRPADVFFNGVFAFHWHNGWSLPIERDSVADGVLKMWGETKLLEEEH